jgi:hypothetical protein
LRDAVAAATTYRGVLRALGLKNGSLGYVQRCIAESELDTSHFKSRPPTNRLCSDEELRRLVASSNSSTEVLEKLGLEVHGNNFHRLRARILNLDIDASHFSRARTRRANRDMSWTDEDLRAAVAATFTIAQVIRAVGLIPAGGNYDQVQRRIRELGIDTSHFKGRGWNRGTKLQPQAIALSKLLVAGRWTASHKLKLRLFREGLKEAKCELCGWCERAPDGRIPVELDHINGDKNDNRLENLRILCPNCHSLQPTHRGLNQRRRSVALVGFEPTLAPF